MSGRAQQDLKNEKWIDEHIGQGSEYLRSYIKHMKVSRKSPATRKAYLGYLTQYESFLKQNSIEVCSVRPMDIDSYIEYISKTNGKVNNVSIINTKLAAVTSFYSFMLDNDLVQKNPCLRKKLKQTETKSITYLDSNEEALLKENIIYQNQNRKDKWRSRDLCIVTLGIATGLRVSEIVNIDVDDIDFENMQIKNIKAKGNKTRVMLIGSKTVKCIQNWMEDREKYLINKDEPALFISQKQNRISQRAVEDMIAKETKNMKKHITPHKLRSTCATKLYNKTGDIALTAQQLGHSNIKTTQIYAAVSDKRMREAATILD